eukprot:8219633-Heterocapsa_arctica.AAC.1
MRKNGRTAALKGVGDGLRTGTWVALGPPFTEHLVPIALEFPLLFPRPPAADQEAQLARRLLMGE